MAAIYMWPVEDGFIITTTPYPIDAQDAMEFSVRPQASTMHEIWNDDVSVSADAISGTYEQKRWFYDETIDPDDIAISVSAIGGTYEQKRWFYEENLDPDDITVSVIPVEGTYVRKKIILDSPDELLQLACVIQDTCTMTAA